MKKGERQLGPDLWQLWKESLATSAAILAFFALIDITLAYFLHYEHHIQSVVSQLTLWLPLSIFVLATVPFVSATVAHRLTFKCTERKRRKVGIILTIVASLGIIIWVIAKQIWNPQGIWMWLVALVVLILASAGRGMFLQRHPLQSEKPPSKAKEREEAPSTPKPERAKIIGLAALLVLLLAIVLTKKRK